MSSVTDPYQPIESKQQLTRQLLTVMLVYQPTLVIQTRSPIILRDIDLLRQFQRLRINMSIPTGSEKVRKDFEPRSPSVKARLKAIGKLKHSLPCDEKHEIRCSVTITPLLPTFSDDETNFIHHLAIVDRVVVQEFHPSHAQSLIASTRQEALALKQKYAWWYQDEENSYREFKQKLLVLERYHGIEVKEGKEGFTYD
jgi:DNA repair photolyase